MYSIKRLRYGRLLLVSVLVGVATTYVAEGRPRAKESSEERVVSYLKNYQYPNKCLPPGCEWRVYSPFGGTDELVLTLPRVPQNAFWSEDFVWVYYRLGKTVYRFAWKRFAESEAVADLPFSDRSVMDIWRVNETGAWRFAKFIFHTEGDCEVAIWEQRVTSAKWQVVTRHPKNCDYGDWAEIPAFADILPDRATRVRLRELLLLQRVEHRLAENGKRFERKLGDRVYYFPSSFVRDRGIRVTVSLGDTLHAIAPLFYASADGSVEKLIFDSRRRRECSPYDQLGFQEFRGYMLVGTEYQGDCGQILDMRTGEVVRELGKDSGFAVWIPPLKK